MNRQSILIWKDGGPQRVAGYVWNINGIPVAAFREVGEHEYNFVDLRTGDVFGNTKAYTLKEAADLLRRNVPGPWFPARHEITERLLTRMNAIANYKGE